MEFEWDTTFTILFGMVVLVRFLLPFLIFRYPLPGIIGCLIVDAVDQTIFQYFGYDPPFYQGYDKAMDVFYLGIAFISTMRNWLTFSAIGVSRFLFFYRQIGVVAFELTGVRALLIIFPNTFEYFFIAFEGIRARWNAMRFSMRFWVGTAMFIWIVIKLPQEYWIHIAQLDVTDTWQDVAWFPPLVIGLGVTALLVLGLVVRPRLDSADHALQIKAPAMPPELATGAQRAAFVSANDRVFSAASFEKFMLIGLLSVIFASVLPNADPSPARLMGWIGVFVVVNAAMNLALARRGFSARSTSRSFLLRYLVNLAMLGFVDRFVDTSMPLVDALFFVLLFSVLVTAYDRYRPIYDFRVRDAPETKPVLLPSPDAQP